MSALAWQRLPPGGVHRPEALVVANVLLAALAAPLGVGVAVNAATATGHLGGAGMGREGVDFLDSGGGSEGGGTGGALPFGGVPRTHTLRSAVERRATKPASLKSLRCCGAVRSCADDSASARDSAAVTAS